LREGRPTYAIESSSGTPKHLYERYAPSVGSVTAQQITNKNNEAWRSFFKLKGLEVEGRLPEHITRVSMPRYWKKYGKRELRVVIRNDCYRIDKEHLYLPKGIKLRYKGDLEWKGKQGRLEIVYDDVDGIPSFYFLLLNYPFNINYCHNVILYMGRLI